MKTLLKILIPLTLLLFIACEKEELEPTPSSATIRQSISLEQSSPEILTRSKPMITRTYTEAFDILPIKTDQELLALTANCDDRENIATKYNMSLENLTIATEIADLKRTGITTDLAATIHAATHIGILDIISGKTDFIGIIDLVGGKRQTLDVGLLSKVLVKPFYQVITNFMETQCADCINTPTPTFETINHLINSAKHLPVMVSYEKEGNCWAIGLKRLNADYSNSSNYSITENGPTVSVDRKTMITRTYSQVIKVLPIKTDKELLVLTANCKNRDKIATQYNMDLEHLTIAAEIADLKRTGITTELAATIHAATFIGIIDIISDRTDFVGIIDLIGGKHQTLDIGLLSKMPVKSFSQVITNFIETQCPDCINTSTPTFETINNLINIAKRLPIKLSYEKEGSCWAIGSKRPNTDYSNSSSYSINKNGPTVSVDRKPMLIRTYTESFDILPIKTDQELLALTANCHNREKIASQYNMDLDHLTIATEIADLKRIGLSTDQAAILPLSWHSNIS